MTQIKLGFIGGGNMARSIVGGLADDNTYRIHVSDPDSHKLLELKAEFGIEICESNEQLMSLCEVVVFSTKPQVMQQIIEPLANFYAQNTPLIISIAAGITSGQILNWLEQPSAACIRVMPNTPALVQSGASGLFAVNADQRQKSYAEKIMNAVGISVWLNEESLIDSVTAVSGSGPAYFFYLMESIYDSAIKNGLDNDVARELTQNSPSAVVKILQTCVNKSHPRVGQQKLL